MAPPIITESRLAKRRAAQAIAAVVNPQPQPQQQRPKSSARRISQVTRPDPQNKKTKRSRIHSPKRDKSKILKARKKAAVDIEEVIEADEDSSDGTIVEYSWPVEPSYGVPSRTQSYYSQIRMSVTTSEGARAEYTIRHGNNIRLMIDIGDGQRRQMFCHVNRFATHRTYERSVKVEGYWYLHRNDLIKYFGDSITPECQDYVNKLQAKELVLTNTAANVDISGIEGNIRVLYIQQKEPIPTEIPPNTYICRYTLEIDTTQRTIEWGRIDPSNLDIPIVDDFAEQVEMESKQPERLPTNESNLPSSSADTDDDTDTSSSTEEVTKETIQEGGGATTPGVIRVDTQLYQADVPPFHPKQTVQSRKPLLVFQANAITDDELHNFLNDVADIHNKYLFQNKMVMEDPYSPLAHKLVEQVAMEFSPSGHLTGSSMSTASMLSGKRCRLLKECDPDAILEILSSHGYNTTSALITIQNNLNRVTAGWSKTERDIFDDAFRRYNGSLREITKVVTPTKNRKDAIDYFYRFKVSDQFRKFQDKKREIAVRMIECIETRKPYSSSVGEVSTINANTAEKPSHWSDRSIASISGARDERIQAAKRLLLDVKDSFDSKRMMEVASVIRQLQDCYEPEGRNFLFKLLDGQPELQRRLLEFLPKHF